MRGARLLGVVVVVGMLGCTQPGGGGAADAAGSGGSTSDAGGHSDAGHQNFDASDPGDAGEPDAGDSDAGTPVFDGGAADGGGDACGEYLDLEHFLVRCQGDPWQYVTRWDDLMSDPACEDYWTIGEDPTHFESRADAIQGKQCDSSCVYVAAVSVMFLRCGQYRWEYIQYHADGEGCEDVYWYPEGVYSSPEAWAADHPCPDAGAEPDAGSERDGGSGDLDGGAAPDAG